MKQFSFNFVLLIIFQETHIDFVFNQTFEKEVNIQKLEISNFVK